MLVIMPFPFCGHDRLDNRALLCGPCNRENRDSQTLIQLRRRVMGAEPARNHRIVIAVARRSFLSRLDQDCDANPKVDFR